MVLNFVKRLKVPHRKVNFVKGFVKTSKEFFQISSVHGIKYLQDSETNYISKCAWIIILIIMFGCANAMVYTFYQNFNSNPIRMNIESDHVPLTNLEFPAVTICPPTPYNYPEVVKIYSNLQLLPNVTIDEAIDFLNQIPAMVGKVGSFDERKLNALQKIIELNNMTTLDFLQLVSWKCDEMLYRCRFQSKVINCSEIFFQSKSHLGYCCSFNTNEFGSTRRAMKFGPEGGLSIILKNTKYHQVGLKRFMSSEHELIVHQNVDYPHRTLPSHSIPMGREIWAIVRPTEIVCTDNFKALSVQERQCLLPYEHNMRFFKTYNSDNCEFECRAMKTFDTCGCVPYIYLSSKNVKACDFSTLPCLHKTYSTFEMNSKMNRTLDTTSACYCPSSCQSVEYDVQVTRARLQTVLESFDPFYHGVKNNFTVLHVFMSSQVYRRLSRDTLSDIVILIGNLGSSYGLFVGISIISLLEIAYFYTLVLWRNCIN